MKRPILMWPDPRLGEVSEPVTLEYQQSEEFERLLEDMFETMYAAGGVGLAAIQVGVPLRVFITDVSGEAQNAPQTYVNPEIVRMGGDLRPVEEGCLSLPGIREQVLRHREVAIGFRTRAGEVQVITLVGLAAQCTQHEIEHLEGRTLADGYGPVKRDLARRKIRKTLRHRKD